MTIPRPPAARHSRRCFAAVAAILVLIIATLSAEILLHADRSAPRPVVAPTPATRAAMASAPPVLRRANADDPSRLTATARPLEIVTVVIAP